jgi:hypothetical protein
MNVIAAIALLLASLGPVPFLPASAHSDHAHDADVHESAHQMDAHGDHHDHATIGHTHAAAHRHDGSELVDHEHGLVDVHFYTGTLTQHAPLPPSTPIALAAPQVPAPALLRTLEMGSRLSRAPPLAPPWPGLKRTVVLNI